MNLQEKAISVTVKRRLRVRKQCRICHPPLYVTQKQRKAHPDAWMQEKESAQMYVSLDTRNFTHPIRNTNLYTELESIIKSTFKSSTTRRLILLEPYKPLFDKILSNVKICCKQYDKTKSDVFDSLNWVVPSQYFGSAKHRKLFYKLVKMTLSCAKYECIYIQTLVCDFRVENVPWAAAFKDNEGLCKKAVYTGNLWLLENIVKPIINHNYYALNAGLTYEIQYVPKHLCQSYRDKVHDRLHKLQYIKEMPSSYLKLVKGVLHIVPKSGLHNFDFRSIVHLYRDKRLPSKKNLRILYNYGRSLSRTETGNLFHCWSNFIGEAGSQPIYATKLDVSDAFGNIDIDLLTKVIRSSEWTDEIKVSFISQLQHQFITLKKRKKNETVKVYKWNHGILQGGQLSPGFCELYMSYLDSQVLKPFYKSNCLVHRTVDDYLFCSTDPDDVQSFHKAISSVHKLNMKKSQSYVHPQDSPEIEYCGMLINVKTREMKGRYAFKKDTQIRYKFKLWNRRKPLKPQGFVARAMHFPYNSHHFSKEQLNTSYNSEDVVLRNVFHAMILLAFKYDAAVSAIYKPSRIVLFGKILATVVWRYSKKILRKLERFAGSKYTGNIKFETLVLISYASFSRVLERKYLIYKVIVDEIKKKVKKMRVAGYDPHMFKKMPGCFDTIRMSRSINIVT